MSVLLKSVKESHDEMVKVATSSVSATVNKSTSPPVRKRSLESPQLRVVAVGDLEGDFVGKSVGLGVGSNVGYSVG